MLPNELSFNHNGHHYHLVKVEGSDDYSVIRDNRNVRRISKETLSHGNIEQVVEDLFSVKKGGQ